MFKMLPWSLAVYRVRNGRAMPIFRDLSGKNWEIAQKVIETFKMHEGKTKKELYEKLDEITITPSYKFVKGLIRIMERRTIYEDAQDSFEFRKKVFKKYPEKPEIRAKELNMDVDEMLKKMFADINPVIVKVMDTKPSELIMEYNLSLAQTMLFRATSMEITFSEKRVYSALKYLGLLYTMPSENMLIVDGPVSIFSHTTRYGTRFARLLPFIVYKSPWSVKASLKLKEDEAMLEMDHLRHGYYFPKREESVEEEELIDARVCEVRKFGKPVKIGNEYFLPQYKVACRNRSFYVETFKFWSWKYIEGKARMASEHNFPLILLLEKDGNLSGKMSEKNLENVLFFKNKITDELLMKAANSLKIEKEEEDKDVEIGNARVPLDKLIALRDKLKSVESYAEAERIITSENLPVMETLHYLGFRIIWKGLEPYKIKHEKDVR